MDPTVDKVEATGGGKVLVEKFSIGEHCNLAYIQVTEGNKIRIHSME